MDEPFGALDAMTRQVLQDEVLRIAESGGTSVFFVTHDLEEAIYLGDRVVALRPNPGRVAQMFDVHLPRPRNQFAPARIRNSCDCAACCSISSRKPRLR